MKTRLKSVVIILAIYFILAGLSGCGGQSSDPELEKAADVIHYMMVPRNLKRSAFAAAFENPTPSKFVSYIFSPMGAAEWPMPADDFEREQMQSIGAPIAPANIGFSPLKVSGQHNRQIVVKYNDETNMVIVEAYNNQAEEAIFTREWELPSVKPAPGVREIFESNKGMGLSYQSF